MGTQLRRFDHRADRGESELIPRGSAAKTPFPARIKSSFQSKVNIRERLDFRQRYPVPSIAGTAARGCGTADGRSTADV